MPKKGIKMPKVGMRTADKKGVLDALFSHTQQRVLGLLFGQPGRGYTITELIALTEAGSGNVQREVKKLVESSFVEVVQLGREKRYRANARGFLYVELKSIVDKTIGVASALRSAIEEVRDQVSLAVLFGSVAKSSDTSVSDIDVLMVSDTMSVGDALQLFAPVEAQLGRQISPSIYTRREFRRSRKDPFLSKLFIGEHVVLIGDPDEV